jgi:N-acetylglucosamine transport system substrate-binding protein
MKTLEFGLGLLTVCLVLTGCGDSGKSGTSEAKATEDKVTIVEAPAPAPGKKYTGKLEVQAFKGGYGIDFYETASKEFASRNPGLNVEVAGDPHVWEQLKPRFVANDVPDLVFPGWGMDHWALADEGQLFVLDTALDSPAGEGSGNWRDTFEPSLLKLGIKEGHQYVLPYYFNVQGWWYDPELFAKNGWAPPKTYPDLLALCEKIKAKGIAPLTFQGKYPYYMLEGMLLPWAVSVGGLQAVTDAQNLVPGAWKSTSILAAAKMIDQLRVKGYFQNGAVGMSHTESQTEFLNGHAAMIPCGTWLYAEMKKVMRPGAKMQFLMPPLAAEGKGDPTALLISIEPWMIASKAKNPEAALALFKYMTTLTKAKQFVEQKGTLMAIKGSDQAKLPETLVVASKAFKNSKSVWSYIARQWYPAMEKEIENALTSMLNGEITPEQFCDRAEAAAQKTKSDDSISKHQVE